MIGETLGQYRIDARLGSGGMGVVYRAHDERLHRQVAIKIVGVDGGGPSTPEDHARLLAEARASSALNHPHICTVYEVGESHGRAFIVMEYVEGKPLSQMVPHAGLPSDTVARYGAQIADALGHAHQRGVIHRDLKTANIVISAQDVPKVLDFGLAGRIEPRDNDTATRSSDVVEGSVLAGTLPYLPPEVLLGQPADARSDIWSLGVVLYEIATGHLPFEGRNQFDLTAAILRAPPQPFPSHVPPTLRTVVMRCLAKEPTQRYQHAGEVRAALEAIRSDITGVTAVRASRGNRPLIIAGAVILIASAATALMLLMNRRSDWESVAGRRLNRILSSEDPTSDPVLSPDGGMLCYVLHAADGRRDLYAGRVAGGARIPLTDDDAIEGTPRFSPDGEQVAFTRRTGADAIPEVRIVPSLGGDVVATIARSAFPSWSPDGRRLAYVREAEGGSATELVVSAVDGTAATVVLPADSLYPFLRYPAWSPDGAELAVVRGTGGVAGEIWLVPVQGGKPRRLLDEPATIFSDYPSFTPDGRGIVHSSNRGGATNVWVVSVAGGVPQQLTTGPGPDESPSVAKDGSIAFVNSRWRNLLRAHDQLSGASRTLVTHSPYLWAPAVSPDGREIAFSRSEVDGAWQVWSVPMEGGAARRLTSGEGGAVYPRWAPDAAFILFHSWSAPRRIGRVPRNGGPVAWLSFGSDGRDAFADISPDGRLVAFTRADAETERVYLAELSGGASRPVTSASGSVPKWSPDGLRIVFSGNRSFSGGIFTIRPDGTEQRQISREGGWPVWWPDGKQIGYIAVDAKGNQEIRVVPADGGTPRPLTEIRMVGTNHPFAVAPDGRTIVVATAEHISDEIWVLQRK
jgi:Tol biopolymer transport system component